MSEVNGPKIEDAKARIARLAEDGYAKAEQLNVSVSAQIAEVYACLEQDAYEEAVEALKTMDSILNDAMRCAEDNE